MSAGVQTWCIAHENCGISLFTFQEAHLMKSSNILWYFLLSPMVLISGSSDCARMQQLTSSHLLWTSSNLAEPYLLWLATSLHFRVMLLFFPLLSSSIVQCWEGTYSNMNRPGERERRLLHPRSFATTLTLTLIELLCSVCHDCVLCSCKLFFFDLWNGFCENPNCAVLCACSYFRGLPPETAVRRSPDGERPRDDRLGELWVSRQLFPGSWFQRTFDSNSKSIEILSTHPQQ